jgi:hypothetical protein
VSGRHAAWALVGAGVAVGFWESWHIAGATLLLGSIVAAFVVARLIGFSHAWVALLVCGVLMSGVLVWATVTSARCPEEGTKVLVKAGKPAVTCDELRTSYSAMAVVFALIAGMGIGWQRQQSKANPYTDAVNDRHEEADR